MIDHHAALIQTMFLVSAADADMTDAELASSARSSASCRSSGVTTIPNWCHAGRMRHVPRPGNGLELGLKQIREALPAKLRETAYAIACDVVAVDGEATQRNCGFSN